MSYNYEEYFQRIKEASKFQYQGVLKKYILTWKSGFDCCANVEDGLEKQSCT